jgi:STE24 endopeptidase
MRAQSQPDIPSGANGLAKNGALLFSPVIHLVFLSLLLTGLFCNAATASSRTMKHRLQNAPMQTYQEHPAPTQPAVPGTAAKESQPPGPPKTEQYTLSPERYNRAIAYSRARYVLYFVSYGLIVLVLILFLRLGVSAKLRNFAERISGNWVLQGLVFVPLLIMALDGFDLPVRIYGHSLSLRYEQSVQGWGSWCLDWGKEELLGIGFALVLVLILFAMIRRSPRRWWLYFWFMVLPFILLIVFLEPLVIDPMFHRFEPLTAKYGQLADAIEKIAQRAGLDIPESRMFLMEASKKTNEVNAYVTGLGASKRVVVWDTTIEKMSTNETLFVFGHESGHYVLNHVRKGFLFFAALFFVALYVGYRSLHWVLLQWGAVWRLYGAEDWASFTAILLIFHVLMFCSLPIANGFSRMQEHAADVYGLEVIHGIVPNSEEVAAHAFQVLGEIDLADPNPPAIITFWLYSHPPLAERLVFAHSYDPWSKGESPKYVRSTGK